MDDKSARQILSAYRPSGTDRRDPDFAEALAKTDADHALKRWFESQLAGDRAIASTLRSIRAPVERKERLLRDLNLRAGARRFLPINLDWKLVGAATAAIAAIAVLVLTLLPAAPPPRSLAAMVAAATTESERQAQPTRLAPASGELLDWLREQGAPAPDGLPPGLARLPSIGCRILSWNEVPVSQVSLRLPPRDANELPAQAGPRVLFLYVVRQSSCSSGGADVTPAVFRRGGQSVATWRDASRFFILVGRIEEGRMRAILEESPAVALRRAKKGLRLL